MEVFKWISVIVLIVVGAEVIKMYIKSKATTKSDEELLNKQQAQIDELNRRVAVLEKIVTDPSESLKREINQLND
ncbi:hypothetical protein [Pleionea litopenaei]|uniref:Phage shock protein B n=1 Tax=Pleionea litopenaei TaxID=3070815 RepID=A0AA51X5Z0_9GAMM|nr:hypothetical protein [Pleionea sp. HL-JVS1]WMS85540.1 hypothetical protein Q9312_09975 [Pleionea sp. HL-JVS1]